MFFGETKNHENRNQTVDVFIQPGTWAIFRKIFQTIKYLNQNCRTNKKVDWKIFFYFIQMY